MLSTLDTLNGDDRNAFHLLAATANNLETNQEEISYRTVEHQDSLNHILRSEHRAEIEVHFQINHQEPLCARLEDTKKPSFLREA